MNQRAFRRFLTAGVLGLAVALPLHAQEGETQDETREGEYESAAHGMDAMMEAWAKAGAPTEKHEALAPMVGTWEATVRMWMDPSGEPMTSEATIENRMVLGGRFLEEVVRGDFMGQPFEGRGLTGYNNLTEKYESTWVDNVSTAIYRYEGTMEDGALTMSGEHLDPTTDETLTMTGTLEVVSEDEMQYTAWEDRGDGPVKVMEIEYRRQG